MGTYDQTSEQSVECMRIYKQQVQLLQVWLCVHEMMRPYRMVGRMLQFIKVAESILQLLHLTSSGVWSSHNLLQLQWNSGTNRCLTMLGQTGQV